MARARMIAWSFEYRYVQSVLTIDFASCVSTRGVISELSFEGIAFQVLSSKITMTCEG